jgi:hypothetical protein
MKRIRSTDGDYIELCGTIEAETEKAILFFDGIKKVWLPKSQLEDIEWNADRKTVTVTMKEWLANAKELL